MDERSTPLISVVVPFFNSARYLAPCIESLLALEAGPGQVELIFVDNGSSDDSAAIVGRYEGITLLRETTPGAYPARNRGIQVARAPIIAFTDADCTVDENWAQVILDRMSNPVLGILIGHCRFPSAASLPLRLIGAWENAKAQYIAQECPPAHRIAYCNNMAVQAALFAEVGPFRDWRRAGDSEFAHRMARERPDLALAFEPAMRITHHEFVRARDRARRLRLYTDTNTQIEDFRELDTGQRLAVLWHLLHGAGH
jgi:glycosyltransferase involved in cell wall biosynthesis